MVAGSDQDVKRAADVRRHVGIRGDVRVGNCDQSCEVINDVAASDDSADEVRISDVARNHLDTSADVRRERIQPTP